MFREWSASRASGSPTPWSLHWSFGINRVTTQLRLVSSALLIIPLRKIKTLNSKRSILLLARLLHVAWRPKHKLTRHASKHKSCLTKPQQDKENPLAAMKIFRAARNMIESREMWALSFCQSRWRVRIINLREREMMVIRKTPQLKQECNDTSLHRYTTILSKYLYC